MADKDARQAPHMTLTTVSTTVGSAITGASAGALVGSLGGAPGVVIGAVVGAGLNIVAGNVSHHHARDRASNQTATPIKR